MNKKALWVKPNCSHGRFTNLANYFRQAHIGRINLAPPLDIHSTKRRVEPALAQGCWTGALYYARLQHSDDPDVAWWSHRPPAWLWCYAHHRPRRLGAS